MATLESIDRSRDLRRCAHRQVGLISPDIRLSVARDEDDYVVLVGEAANRGANNDVAGSWIEVLRGDYQTVAKVGRALWDDKLATLVESTPKCVTSTLSSASVAVR